jgi:hypothetical protein
MPVNSSTGSYNFVRYQFLKKTSQFFMLEKGFRPFSCTSRCAVLWVFCSLESMKNLLTEMCGSCRELIDRNLQGPLDPAIGNLSQLVIL